MTLRFERMESDFMRVLSEAIRNMKDPRIHALTSITRAELTKDLKHAKVYVSVLEDDEEKRRETIEVLNNANAMLGHEVNNRMKMRRIPEMHFVMDDSIGYSVHIGKILDEIHKSDES